LQLCVFVYLGTRSHRLTPAELLRTVNKGVFYGVGALATAAVALQPINFAVWNRFWPFFALIFMHLIAALAQFIRMVLLPHDSSPS
jgi:hypothetical protein